MGIFDETMSPSVPDPVTIEPDVVVKPDKVVTGYVYIEDIKTGGIDITLTNGANLRVPKNGKSKPVLRKLVPDYINKLEKDKELKIVNC
jgi:hypothetical protein